MKLIKLLLIQFLDMLMHNIIMTAVTLLSDIIKPVVYTDYAREASIYKNAFFRSGIITISPEIGKALAGGSDTFTTPFWKGNVIVGADAAPVVENGSVNPDAITADKMVIRRQFREKAFGQNDLTAVLVGEKPMDAISLYLNDFWDRNFNKILFKTVQGVIAGNVANNSSDQVKDITGDAYPYMNSDAVIEGVGLFGDNDEGIVGIAMHSKVKETLRKANLIDMVPDNEQNIMWETYLGKRVFTDDSLLVSSTYWTVLLKPGAFGWNQSFVNYVPTELERKPSVSGGQEILYTRRVFAMHPYGYRWTDASVAGNFPTDAELTTAANWVRTVNMKNTKFVVIKSNG